MKTYTLRPNVSLPKIYLYRNPIDFRKGHRGLGVIIEQELTHDPFSGTLYVFINRQRNKLKALFSVLAPASPYLPHPCGRGKTTVSCSITKPWPKKQPLATGGPNPAHDHR